MPARTNLNRAEKTCVEYIALLDMELNKAQGVLESRLRSTTDAWRQFRIAQVALGKALEGIYDTMTVKNLSQLLEFSTRGNIYIDLKRASRPAECDVVPADILNRIIAKACDHECRYCLKTPIEMAGCPLRKDLDVIAPAEKTPKHDSCPYWNYKEKKYDRLY